jgi:chromosome segregation ATPase
LCHSLDAMETRCEEITRQLEEAQAAERRRQKASQAANSNGHPQSTPSSPKKSGDAAKSEVDDLANEVAVLRAQKSKEHRRAEELEEQLTTLIQENATIEEQLAAFKMREEQLRSFEEEITSM